MTKWGPRRSARDAPCSPASISSGQLWLSNWLGPHPIPKYSKDVPNIFQWRRIIPFPFLPCPPVSGVPMGSPSTSRGPCPGRTKTHRDSPAPGRALALAHLGFFGDTLPSGRGHASATSGYREDDESGCHKRYPNFQIPSFFNSKSETTRNLTWKQQYTNCWILENSASTICGVKRLQEIRAILGFITLYLDIFGDDDHDLGYQGIHKFVDLFSPLGYFRAKPIWKMCNGSSHAYIKNHLVGGFNPLEKY